MENKENDPIKPIKDVQDLELDYTQMTFQTKNRKTFSIPAEKKFPGIWNRLMFWKK